MTKAVSAVLRFEDALAKFQGLRIAGLIAIPGKLRRTPLVALSK